MDNYLDSFREMISLRGLTDHTLKSYCTYINAYLDYLTNILHKSPEDVSWEELRDYIRWLQTSRNLSDRTINCAISQLRFFTMYVLHKPWDDTQLPLRKFDEYLPFVPSKEETWQFISTMPDLKPQTMVALMYSSPNRGAMTDLLIPFFSQDISMPMKKDWGGNEGLPAILSAMLLAHICMKMVPTYLPLKLLWDISP